jgi:hypothetical protein
MGDKISHQFCKELVGISSVEKLPIPFKQLREKFSGKLIKNENTSLRYIVFPDKSAVKYYKEELLNVGRIVALDYAGDEVMKLLD